MWCIPSQTHFTTHTARERERTPIEWKVRRERVCLCVCVRERMSERWIKKQMKLSECVICCVTVSAILRTYMTYISRTRIRPSSLSAQPGDMSNSGDDKSRILLPTTSQLIHMCFLIVCCVVLCCVVFVCCKPSPFFQVLASRSERAPCGPTHAPHWQTWGRERHRTNAPLHVESKWRRCCTGIDAGSDQTSLPAPCKAKQMTSGGARKFKKRSSK